MVHVLSTAHHFASFLLAAGSTGGGRTFGWSLGLCGLLGGGIGETCGMFCESISYVLVHTNGSFRVFIVAMDVLCDDVTPVTFCFCDSCPTRSNHRIVVVDEIAAVGGEVDGLQGSFPIGVMRLCARPIGYSCDTVQFVTRRNVVQKQTCPL
jgi:hypothetical protein